MEEREGVLQKGRSGLAHLNLRRNPFGAVPQRDWPALTVADTGELRAHLRKGRAALQLVGACGRGKSTHLRALHGDFPDAFYSRIAEGERPSIPRRKQLFIDESQRLPWWKREWLFRGCETLAVATHALHTAQLERLGFAVLTVEIAGLTLARLQTIVQRRLTWAHNGRGPLPTLPSEGLQGLLATHGDDLRAIEHALYEIFQQTKEWNGGRIRFDL